MTVAENDILTAVAAGTGCGLVLLDESGLVEYWSLQLEEASGLPVIEVVGKAWSDLLAAAENSAAQNQIDSEVVDSTPLLSQVVFYPVSAGAGSEGKQVGVLRLGGTYVDYGEGFPFAVETASGIPSRRALFEIIQSQIACKNRYHTPFSLLFIRMENHRTFMEALGAELWERTNRTIFDQLNAITRMADSVGLYDESTFWVILVNSDYEGARVTADKIKHLTSTMKLDRLDLALSVVVVGVMARSGEDHETLVCRGLSLLDDVVASSSSLAVEE